MTIFISTYIYIYIIFISDMHREEIRIAMFPHKSSVIHADPKKHRKGQGKWQGKG